MTMDGYTEMGGTAYARKMIEEGIANMRDQVIPALEARSPWETDAGILVAAQLGYARAQLKRMEESLARTEATDE